MKIIINNAIINTDHFPVITTADNVLLFGYEDDFNTPIQVYFASSDEATQALGLIAQGFSNGDTIIEIEGGSFDEQSLEEETMEDDA